MIRKLAFNMASRLVLQPYRRQMKGLTLGTRIVVTEAARVLLVRHTYAPGWLFPGGGVDRGETIYEAAVREVREEAGIVAEEEPALHGIFLNDKQFPGDHVACLVLREFSKKDVRSFEIAEAQFFAITSLPEGTTGGTRRRIAEIFEGRAVSRHW
jgi:8-oxo-dGTP pyrophosphatase MutT (NUDIX family)